MAKDALGHGSEKRGEHASGVERIGQPVSISQKVFEVIRNNPNGFSVTPAGKQPTKGYMVSQQGTTLNLPLNALATGDAHKIMQGYASMHAAALRKSGAHFGGWHDKETGHVVLDVSHNIKNRNAAVRAGVARNQKAIWDVRKKREILTGGTGD